MQRQNKQKRGVAPSAWNDRPVLMMAGRKGVDSMAEKEVLRYLFLVDRKLTILLNSGINWKPEYEDELKSIDMELVRLRKLVDAEHIKRGQTA